MITKDYLEGILTLDDEYSIDMILSIYSVLVSQKGNDDSNVNIKISKALLNDIRDLINNTDLDDAEEIKEVINQIYKKVKRRDRVTLKSDFDPNYSRQHSRDEFEDDMDTEEDSKENEEVENIDINEPQSNNSSLLESYLSPLEMELLSNFDDENIKSESLNELNKNAQRTLLFKVSTKIKILGIINSL